MAPTSMPSQSGVSVTPEYQAAAPQPVWPPYPPAAGGVETAMFPMVAEPMPARSASTVRVPLLADELFYVLLDDRNGKLRVHADLAGRALAAALFAELVLGRFISIDDDGVYLDDDARRLATVPRDALQHMVLDVVLGQDEPLAPQHWISYVAATAETEVADRLGRANQITANQRRRITGKVNIYQPARPNDAAWPRARLSEHCRTGRILSQTDLLLVGICHAAGLLHDVLVTAPSGTYDAAVQHVETQLRGHESIFALLHALDRMVTAKAGQLA
ncbi:GPP34 family phosphoprotein [Actinoplanes sp. CA-054009]